MKILSITAIALFLTNYAGAAEEPNAKPVPTSSAAQQDDSPLGTQVQTSGKVVSVHSCPMVGVADPHMVVKLQTEQGDTDIVDLGSAAELKTNGIEPKEGQQLWIDGRVGKINDKFLIVAEQLSESKMVAITRTSALTEETVKHAEARTDGKEVIDAKPINNSQANETPGTANATKDSSAPKRETVNASQQVRTIEGTVIHTRHMKIEGESDEHVLAKIKTANGTAVIDLGTCAMMPNNVNLTDGQNIVATGFVGELNGKPIILADTVGNISSIQRAEAIPTSSAPANSNR